MYTPKHNREEDRAVLMEFMKAHSFATLITVKGNMPRATHLPFMLEMQSERITLVAHMARANSQWRDFAEEREALVIFQEPHAYVSPRHYETAQNVPTWNYVAVHAYGHPVVLEGRGDKLALLERLIREHDEAYFQKWLELPKEYINTKLDGIVAFRIDVERLEARWKLSQDRTVTERENIIEEFAASDDGLATELAELMKRNLR